jgi:phosphoribosylformimino-5-aminoimidazole carboxamide ribotide isomerase
VRIIPVIDLKDGQVVHGVAGRRETYRPIVSRLTNEASPESVAAALVREFAFTEVYVADLDAIAGAEPNWRALSDIGAAGLRVWLDAGTGSVERVNHLLQFAGGTSALAAIVIGLESVPDPTTLAALFDRIADPQRAVFSLDLKEGEPLTQSPGWQTLSPQQIADVAIQIGFRRLIILDLARVGTGTGTGIESLCRRLHQSHPHIDLIAGGGVRHKADLQNLASAGCAAALVASALHDGRLTKADFS